MKELKKTLLNQRSLINFARSMLTTEETQLIIERLSIYNTQRKQEEEKKQKDNEIRAEKMNQFIQQLETEGLSITDLQFHISNRNRAR
ncbi:H-NS family histone-like protein [Aliivibrio fischeri]|uniref:DNA-binding protein H-NS-like N-terminal domain-containing protein n=1 Tax=Aliivibrio fischeri (strain MJ11) TaxID=388396 RepID=B5EWD6_ALIFM|nr:hypothetical protein [Aliivibrio fischeri]ACH64685.1 hypothetical protein VFMJ11_B0192 [Aliivibrio fischeri MJ11]